MSWKICVLWWYSVLPTHCSEFNLSYQIGDFAVSVSSCKTEKCLPESCQGNLPSLFWSKCLYIVAVWADVLPCKSWQPEFSISCLTFLILNNRYFSTSRQYFPLTLHPSAWNWRMWVGWFSYVISGKSLLVSVGCVIICTLSFGDRIMLGTLWLITDNVGVQRTRFTIIYLHIQH
jgi:hypothetical protein